MAKYKNKRNKNPRTNNQPKRRQELPDIKNLEKEILGCIIGQDIPVRKIITAIYRAISFPSIKSNTLIIGGSGTGKTETIKQVAKRLRIPYTIEDATQYTQQGYYGPSVEEMLEHLIDNAGGNVQKAQRGILVIDEIDKKRAKVTQEIDVSGVEVLNSLLKIIEGKKMMVSSKDPFMEDFAFDTSRLIVIFLGAFSGLEKIRDKRLNTNPIGFSNPKYEEVFKTGFFKQDLIKYGFPEEFVGRIDTIVEMNKLTKHDLTSILKDSKLSIFRKYQEELWRKGIALKYEEGLFERIAEESLTLDTGARELSNTVNNIFENIIYDILANPNKYHTCNLSLEIVRDNTKYSLS